MTIHTKPLREFYQPHATDLQDERDLLRRVIALKDAEIAELEDRLRTAESIIETMNAALLAGWRR